MHNFLAPFISHVKLKNYRSIAACDVALHPLTVLVGSNGAGKSNFLDALKLVADSLRSSLEHALRERGGINEVRRRSSGHPNNVGIRADFSLPDGTGGHYAFELSARAGGDFVVKREECKIGGNRYEVREGQILTLPSPSSAAPPASKDRLYLVNAAGLPAFRPVYDAFEHMGFYNLNPAVMREFQIPDKGDLLKRDGANLASVLDRLEKAAPSDVKDRIEAFLQRVVPGVVGVARRSVETRETIEFKQTVEGSPDPWRFSANTMSDGTLRALGILVALFQSRAGNVPLIGIEEPEAALHPAAAGILRDALREGSRYAQVLVTSHSPDLLDDPSIDDGEILAVSSTQGRTDIARLDEVGRAALRDRLYTVGELLRANQLEPDRSAIPTSAQLRLF